MFRWEPEGWKRIIDGDSNLKWPEQPRSVLCRFLIGSKIFLRMKKRQSVLPVHFRSDSLKSTGKINHESQVLSTNLVYLELHFDPIQCCIGNMCFAWPLWKTLVQKRAENMVIILFLFL